MEHFCFATLALGNQYRFHAKVLALDLQAMAQGTTLVVLTDCPTEFSALSNVRAIKHRQRSLLYCYHDKRFVVEEALARFRSCIFIDADSRIRQNVPSTLDTVLGTGIGAVSAQPLLAKYQCELSEDPLTSLPWKNTARRQLSLMEQGAEKVGVDLQRVQFVWEGFFSVAADGQSEVQFLDAWGQLARFFELRGFSWGEGNAIGIAAEHVGWKISVLPAIKDWLFKDLLYPPAEVKRDSSIALMLEHRRLYEQLFRSSGVGLLARRVRTYTSTCWRTANALLRPGTYPTFPHRLAQAQSQGMLSPDDSPTSAGQRSHFLHPPLS